ncbi:hypothetical protein P3875_01720 [Myroides sp. JBRI-B21084]|uniref:hypothetical protein n=1 Tax=Myroides sp. JBRI-B21084 TaxID=3119977 RepID=UPI0026E1B021|nr:hypothetical protein [Paenimyroides cloacae]WKW46819.1 hypothetical protein P3875_01720 [Paenimyroides cloacae]
MKKSLFFLFFISQIAAAQKLSKIDLLSAVADNICSEVIEKKVEIKSEFTMGVYMLKAVNLYKDDIEHYYGKNYVANKEVMHTMGEEIGMYLGLKCPEIFEYFALNQEDETFEETAYLQVTGKFHKTIKNQFLSFVVKEDSGKTHEFLFLHSFDTSFLLTDNLLNANDKIEVTYYVSEIYDAKIGKFVNYNIVSYIEKK